jgi:hypothetical protein
MSYDLTRSTPELPEEEQRYLRVRKQRSVKDNGHVGEDASLGVFAVTPQWMRWALSLPAVSFEDDADPEDGTQPFVLGVSGLGETAL